MRGCMRKSQPIADVKPGTSIPIVISVKSSVFPGRSVRLTSQAAGTPNPMATRRLTVEKITVSKATRPVRASANTSVKFASV